MKSLIVTFFPGPFYTYLVVGSKYQCHKTQTKFTNCEIYCSKLSLKAHYLQGIFLYKNGFSSIPRNMYYNFTTAPNCYYFPLPEHPSPPF